MSKKKNTSLCKGHCGLHYTSNKLLDGKCIACIHEDLKDEIEKLQDEKGDLQDTIKDQNEDIKDLRTTVDLKQCPSGITVVHAECVYQITAATPEEGIDVRAVTQKGLLQSLIILPKTENVIRLIMKDV